MPARPRSDGPVDPARSALMAKVRGKDTRPELVVRKLAHALGFRFRLHRRDLPGSPDLVFPRLHKAVFVHGCFWHRHPGCSKASTPKTRAEFWKSKFAANVQRDCRAIVALEEMGWDVCVVWECETANVMHLARRLKKFLRPGRRKRSLANKRVELSA